MGAGPRWPRAERITHTEGAERPFWSLNSEFIAFSAGGTVKKIPVGGGPPITLCSLPSNDFLGGAWSPDGERILFASGGPASLFGVSARGGQAERAFDHVPMSLGQGATSPHFLPVEAGADVIVFDVGIRPIERWR